VAVTTFVAIAETYARQQQRRDQDQLNTAQNKSVCFLIALRSANAKA
jgi:hypothetical protein